MNKRNTKKFRKKLKMKNNRMNRVNDFGSMNWISKTIKKLFDEKIYKKLIGYMNQNDSLTSSQDVLMRFKKRNELGNQLIDNILKNKNEIKRLLNVVKVNSELYFGILDKFIYLPFNVVGNKYHPKFEEFYDFISQFSLGNIGVETDEEITVFRVMDECEYVGLVNGEGVKSPSYTFNPVYLQFLRGNNTLMDINTKSIFVMCVFRLEDCILSVKSTSENECVIKKGSHPIFIRKFNEYGKIELMNDLGDKVLEYLPLTPDELNNGFTYMDGLMNKGYDLSKCYYKHGNQWFRKDTSKDWINQFYKSIDSVISDYENDKPNIIQLKKQFTEMKNLGNKVQNNPFVD